MKWIAKIPAENIHFEIVPEIFENVSTGIKHTEYYIFRYESGKLTHDYLQEDLETAQSFAKRKFNVLLDAWKQVEN